MTVTTKLANAQLDNSSAPLPDSVQWLEGMLLSPQHLQQNDLYWQEHLRWRLQQALPHSWGVSHLTLEMSQLKAGKVLIKRLECVMPDGTPVIYPGSYTAPLQLDINAALQAQASGVRISLLMPVRSSAGNGCDDAPARHEVIHGALAADANRYSDKVPVDRMRPVISLSTEAPSAQYVVCPLFEVVRRVDSQSIEFKPYHPPLLNWQASVFLGEAALSWKLQNLSDHLWQKLRELAGNRRDDGPNEDDLYSSDTRRQMDMARRLSAVLPQFHVLVQRNPVSPVAVYDSLIALVGAMSGLGANPIPPVPDAYQHDNCEPQFRRALAYVVGKLTYLNSNFQQLSFDNEGQGRFTRALPGDAAADLLLELRLSDGQRVGPAERAALERWLKDACIAGEEALETAQRTRLSARVRALDADDIMQRNLRPGAALFIVENGQLEIAGRGLVPLYAPGQRLVLKGNPQSQGLPPNAVLLHQARAGVARPPVSRPVP